VNGLGQSTFHFSNCLGSLHSFQALSHGLELHIEKLLNFGFGTNTHFWASNIFP
jgi:hypothetical protein